MIANLWFDLKYAWRLLLKTPGPSTLCVLVVALSVGLSIWSYELYYSLSQKPLPFPESERWLSVQVASRPSNTAAPSIDAFTFQELRKRARTVNLIGAYAARSAVLSEGEASTSLRAAAVTPQLLRAMQVAPLIGRLFEDADSHREAAPAAILSFNIWQNYFAADTGIVGKTARIDGRPVRIAAVMPKDFHFFVDFEAWLPLPEEQLAAPSSAPGFMSAFVLLERSQTADMAWRELSAAFDEITRAHPRSFSPQRTLALVPAKQMLFHGALQVVNLIGFLGAAVLLLACVNIGLLCFARLLERSRELALRVAVGSSRARLLRQCLLESVFFVMIGSLVGLVLAQLAFEWQQGLGDFAVRVRAGGRAAFEVGIRLQNVIAALLAASLLWVLSTLLPAWRIAKQDPAQVLAGAGKGLAPRSGKAAGVLVGLQVVVSSFVLVVCANLATAIREAMSEPTGLDSAAVMVSVFPTDLGKRYPTPVERMRYWNELAAAIKRVAPGAQVAYADALPTWPPSVAASVEHDEATANTEVPRLPLTVVSDTYFSTLGIDLIAGRLFDSNDDETAPPVAVLDESMAQRYWPGRNSAQQALGKRIQLDPANGGPWVTVIGVASHVARPYGNSETGVIYRPLQQASPAAFHLIARIPVEPLQARASLRAAAFTVDRDMPLHNLQLFDVYSDAANISYPSLVQMSAAIAAITVILAATGLFGLISRSVAQRTQEVGIRRALGATQWQVTSVFLRQGALYLSLGLLGIGFGVVVTSTLRIPNLLDHVAAVTSGVLLIMTTVIFASSYVPTRRAVALEPGDALRYE